MKWWRRRRAEPPVNVRVVMTDGRTIPLEMVYLGLNEHGLHLWTNSHALGERPRELHADVLPPRSVISIR